MADLAHRPAARPRRLDLFVVAGAAFFVAAVVAAAYPALRAGPETAGGLMLLLGLFGVAAVGLYAFRQAPPAEAGSDLGPLLDALAEPACAIAADGRILAANAAWAAAGGPSGRLARPRGASALFAALKAASRGEVGRCELEWEGRAFGLTATRMDARRLLLRLGPAASAAPAATAGAAEALASTPAELDALAAAAPFGAALLDGPDPFAAAIVEANPALKAMARGLARGRPGRSAT